MRDNKYVVFVANSGSTSTKIALFVGGEKVFQQDVNHDIAVLKACPTIQDQLPIRISTVSST